MRVSEVVFACHSAACRPPTSGGTGGSAGKGPGTRLAAKVAGKATKTGEGMWSIGDFTVRKNPKGTGYLLHDPISGKESRVKTVGGAVKVATKRAHGSTAQAALSTVKSGIEAKKTAPAPAAPTREKHPGTPGYTPRKLSKRDAENEMEMIKRDSDNEGYDFDDRDARQFLSAFKQMRSTGKDVIREYDDGHRRVDVYKGDTDWHTKLDYEVSVPADTVAAWLGVPLD